MTPTRGKRTSEERTPHVPLRRCVVCRQSSPQRELFRFCRDDHDQWQPDPGRKAGGRGAWLCQRCRHEATGKELRRFFRNQAPRIEGLLHGQGGSSAPGTDLSGGMNG